MLFRSPLDPRAGGTNKLIQDGAVLVTKADDVIEVIKDLSDRQTENGDFFANQSTDFTEFENEDLPDLSVHEQIVLLLSPTPTHIDDLVRESGAGIGDVHIVLLELELAGRLERHTGHRVSLV